MKFTATILILLIFANSCTIEKRLHGRGYHISWNKRYSRVKNDASKKKLEEEVVIEEETIDTLESLANEETVVEEEQPQIDSTDFTKEARKKERAEKYPDLPREERKFEPLGILAFKILLINIPIGIIGENAADAKIVGQCEIIFLAVLLVSFFLAVISMIRYFRNPRHYRINIFPFIVILVGLFYLVMFIMGNYVV